MTVALISTYELSRQPFGLSSAAAWLRDAGHRVEVMDAAVSPLDAARIREACLIAFYVPMHTATRLTGVLLPRIRDLNPSAHICAFGLYAPISETYLRELGVRSIIGGEFEPALVALADSLGAGRGSVAPTREVVLDRLEFRVPDRAGMPPLGRYAKLNVPGQKLLAGYTESSRGCKHLCRHCPVVPVYNGSFRVVQAEVVLEDIRRQIHAGAAHITFGDPDFFNGPAHARRVVEALHREFPDVTYDATIKIEHLLQHAALLALLRDTGCLFVTSAVESLDDRVLNLLDKGHTRADFERAVELMRSTGVTLNPTFIAFTPWTTRESYIALLGRLVELDLVDATSPIQLALRLLVPLGSRLLELEDVQAVAGEFDPKSLAYPWKHPDSTMDVLSKQALHAVWSGQKQGRSRRQIFADLWELATERPMDNFDLVPRAAIPYLDEPWYC
jgi:radical SAM superfamily enzyme YgiQ (UPF0313 family)